MSYRVRESGGFSYSHIWQDRAASVCNEGRVFHVSVGTAPQGSLAYMEDVVTPGFRQLQKKGDVVFNPMTRWEYAVACTGYGGAIRSVTNSCENPVQKAEFWVEGPGLFLHVPHELRGGREVPQVQYGFSPSEVNSVGVEASTAVLARRGRGDSNLWETLAEMDKTLGMLSNPIGKLASAVSRAGRAGTQGRLSRFSAKESADGWLATRYGIVPIMRDIENLLNALRKVHNRIERRTTRATAATQVTRNITGNGAYDIINVKWTCLVHEKLTARAMSLDELNQSFMERVGFSQKDLTTLPWELVTRSFVYDWLANVGDFLNAVVPAGPGWKPLGSCLVMEKITTNSWSPLQTTCTNASWELTRPVHGTIGVTQVHKWRQALEAPGITIKSDWKTGNFNRVMDALALAMQGLVKTRGGR